MIIALIFLLLFGSAWLLLAYTPRKRALYCDPAPITRRSVGSIAIYCGDCNLARDTAREQSGQQPSLVPFRTFLTSSPPFRCDTCGGDSFVYTGDFATLWKASIKTRFAAERGLSMVYSDAPREEWEEERI